MRLEVKKPEHLVPSYSLTADLLSYLRCRLQYRYHNGSSLPPSRPVQLWYGEFLHGTLELAFRYWQEQHASGRAMPPFPWPCSQRQWRGDTPEWLDHDIGRLADIIEESLKHQGKQANSTAARNSAYKRVDAAINRLGPDLFPLISAAEQRVIGTRGVADGEIEVRCDQYEVHGVIDVLTSLTLSGHSRDNLVREHLHRICPELQGKFEVIVDYKGTRRPLMNEQEWDHGNWQIQTYAWLRERQHDSLPVAAGILLYINELTPSDAEIRAVRRGIDSELTDVVPKGSDSQIIRMWRPGQDLSQLSPTYLLERAIRVIPITPESIKIALGQFDGVVRMVEEDIANEASGRDILNAWSPTCQDRGTCAACDFRHFCPSPCGASEDYQLSTPKAP